MVCSAADTSWSRVHWAQTSCMQQELQLTVSAAANFTVISFLFVLP